MSRTKRVGEIRIAKRVVTIGHETYPLANISRVQTLRVVWHGKLATFYPLREITSLLLLGGAITLLLPRVDLGSRLGAADTETARRIATAFAALLAVRIAYLLGLLLYRLLLRRKRYALLIETAGTQYTALSGTARNEIHRIQAAIVAAIEDPPSTEQILHVRGDLVVGDKFGGDKIGRDKNIQTGSPA
ncbi:hypothetical protein BX281_0266 [Streptomyces sp. Ag82_O1-15]|uniref:DUF6232 family protein n=1 Tax=Streptomyces sp. Ag82_O1-15 TaxID=1938855 RepID=UPI000BB0CF70|nr:DUF6232 family protein [Streptomyces sp. Ag82_O1-15]PBC92588.1 hypothetical protein BX281_0266 [Streptomyces sp. Ag82_O1-15]